MGFLASQFTTLPYPTGSYTGKTVIITGSNTGLGKEAARHFARLGAAKLILAVRSLDRGAEAKADIEKTTKCGSNVIDVWHIDMGSYASIQDFAAKAEKELDRVDIVIANAGVARQHHHVAEDNEEMITVNVIAPTLLAALLMPKMKATAEKHSTRPTFCFVSSGAHEHTKFEDRKVAPGKIFSTLNENAPALLESGELYPISKLLGIFVVRAMAERYPSSTLPVTINLANPGLCHSSLDRDRPTLAFTVMKTLVARSTEKGSRTLVHGGSGGISTHGAYLSDCAVDQPREMVTDDEGKILQDRIWEELVVKLEKIKSGILNF